MSESVSFKSIKAFENINIKISNIFAAPRILFFEELQVFHLTKILLFSSG